MASTPQKQSPNILEKIMKTFKFTKTEHHQVSKIYGAALTEEQLRTIFENTDMPEDEIDSYINALTEGSGAELFEDAYEIVCDSDILDENWDWLDQDDWWTDRKGGYDVEISFDSSDEQ